MKSHHVSTHRVVETSKGILGDREKIVMEHNRESTHAHPDLEAALHAAGHVVPPVPQSGIGKDPRLDFEEQHWTEEEKLGYRAHVKELIKEGNANKKKTKPGHVEKMSAFWNNVERKESPQEAPSRKSEHRKSGVSDHVRSLQDKLIAEQRRDEEDVKKNAVYVPRVRTSIEERKKALAGNTNKPLRGTMASAGEVEMMPPGNAE